MPLPFPSSRQFNPLEQLLQPKPHGTSQSFDVDEREIAAAALDVAQIRAVDARLMREVFLREPKLLAAQPDGEANS